MIPENAPTLGVLIGLPLVCLAFLGVVLWVYSKHRKHIYEEAANLPLADEE
jgi:cbb3-type cytochrome oxidase subunit 3